MIEFLERMQINALTVIVLGVCMFVAWMIFVNRAHVTCLDLITTPQGRLSRTAIGQTVGIVVAAWAPVYTTMEGKLDVAVLGVSLAYLGLVEGYAKYLRHKRGAPMDSDLPPAGKP